MNDYWNRVEQIQQVYARFGGLLCPPAANAQLEVTEAKLGFQIPQTLRRYYSDIANGGFGPPWGILGVEGGYIGTAGDISSALGNLFDWENGTFRETANLSEKLIVPMTHKVFKPLTHLVVVDRGCGCYDEMRLETGAIYRTGIENGEEIWIQFVAQSIDQYLDMWLLQIDESYQKHYEKMRKMAK